jgi:hypothetical protein
VAVRSHFGLRLDGRNNPARASNRPGRRISVYIGRSHEILNVVVNVYIEQFS